MQKSVEDQPPLPPWAERIKLAREKAGLAQWQLGERIGRSQQTVHGYETGSREPDVSLYKEIARACSVNPVWLVFGEGSSGRSSPDGDQTILGVVAEAEKQSRHFAWAFQQATQFLTEEGIDADFPYVLSYAQKLLGAVEREPDDARVKQTILRTIEQDRAELREHLKRARNQIL